MLSSLCGISSVSPQTPSPGLQLGLQLLVDRHFSGCPSGHLKLSYDRLKSPPCSPNGLLASDLSLLVAPPELPRRALQIVYYSKGKWGYNPTALCSQSYAPWCVHQVEGVPLSLYPKISPVHHCPLRGLHLPGSVAPNPLPLCGPAAWASPGSTIRKIASQAPHRPNESEFAF